MRSILSSGWTTTVAGLVSEPAELVTVRLIGCEPSDVKLVRNVGCPPSRTLPPGARHMCESGGPPVSVAEHVTSSPTLGVRGAQVIALITGRGTDGNTVIAVGRETRSAEFDTSTVMV